MKEEGVTILPVVIVLILSIITGYVVSKVAELTYWISMPLGFVSTMFFIWVIGEIVSFFEPKSRLQKTNLNISEMVCLYCQQPYEEQYYASESTNTFSVHCNNCNHDNIYKFSDYEAYRPLMQNVRRNMKPKISIEKVWLVMFRKRPRNPLGSAIFTDGSIVRIQESGRVASVLFRNYAENELLFEFNGVSSLTQSPDAYVYGVMNSEFDYRDGEWQLTLSDDDQIPLLQIRYRDAVLRYLKSS